MSKVKQMVKSIVGTNVEHKYFDQSLSSGAVVAGNIYNISDITQGSQVTQRLGVQVTLKSIDLRMSFSINANVNQAMVRAILFLDKQGYNAAAVTDVLQAGLVGTSYTDICPYEWNYRKRFKVLYDEVVPLAKGGANAFSFRHVCKSFNIVSQHIGASTTFTNQLYLIFIGSETNVLNISSFQYHSRIEFTDE